MKQIFCENCKYLHEALYEGLSYVYECKAPANLKRKSSWRNEWLASVRHPKKINKYNNCHLFEEKRQRGLEE